MSLWRVDCRQILRVEKGDFAAGAQKAIYSLVVVWR